MNCQGVRVAVDADIDAQFEIRTSVTENAMTMADLESVGVTPASVRAMLGSHARAWVFDDDGTVVGFAIADSASRSIFALFVRPSYQGRGVGRALLAAAEQWLFSQGRGEIWLTTGADPAIRANRFYPRAGWKVVGVDANGELKYVKAYSA